KDALSHAVPDGDTEAVLSAALDLLLEQAAKRRGLVEKPRSAPPRPSNDPRHVPAAIAREVWKRDGGRCAFPLPDGAVCGSTTRLQLDHLIAVALGGQPKASNLRVACERHNQLAARRAFGDRWMDQFARKRPPSRHTSLPSWSSLSQAGAERRARDRK
ncbi:MAG TPA: HNH endonuclease signature motif containing protein, partial [Anaeromyxobacteraceae bacterium]